VVNQFNKVWYDWSPIAAINNGYKSWNNLSYLSYFIGDYVSGGRAFAWEADPQNPDVSSPWHNYIYEKVIDSYNWGCRSFMFWLPYGDYGINPATYGTVDNTIPLYMQGAFGLTRVLQKQLFTTIPVGLSNPDTIYTTLAQLPAGSQTTDRINLLAKCPARHKGFTEAINALVEGRLIPTNQARTPITEPCRVILYISTCRGWSGYRYRSNLLWDELYAEAGTEALADDAFYALLDEHVTDIYNMKGKIPGTEDNLKIAFDAISPSATPGTLPLWESMPDFRTNKLELADWYVLSKVKDMGITCLYESSGSKWKTQAEVQNTDDQGIAFPGTVGGVGSTILDGSSNPIKFYDNKWTFGYIETEPFFWLKRAQGLTYTNIVDYNDVDNPLRILAHSTFPPPVDGPGDIFDGDIYGAPETIYYSGTSYNIVNPNKSGGSPHVYMWYLYGVLDSYKWYSNLWNNTSYTGVELDHNHFAALSTFNYRNGNYKEGAYDGTSNPDFAYLDRDIPTYAPRLPWNSTEFVNQTHATYPNPSYQYGYWTTDGKTAWDTQVRASSYTAFLDNLDTIVTTNTGTYPNDTLTRDVVDLVSP
jgi:hypothetical protein